VQPEAASVTAAKPKAGAGAMVKQGTGHFERNGRLLRGTVPIYSPGILQRAENPSDLSQASHQSRAVAAAAAAKRSLRRRVPGPLGRPALAKTTKQMPTKKCFDLNCSNLFDLPRVTTHESPPKKIYVRKNIRSIIYI
jgi:hypothetical protein